jgi:CTP synthase (UTP-ammonia lyase)
MSEIGVVIELVEIKTNTWFVGGTASPSLKARVILEKTSEERHYLLSDIMRVD